MLLIISDRLNTNYPNSFPSPFFFSEFATLTSENDALSSQISHLLEKTKEGLRLPPFLLPPPHHTFIKFHPSKGTVLSHGRKGETEHLPSRLKRPISDPFQTQNTTRSFDGEKHAVEVRGVAERKRGGRGGRHWKGIPSRCSMSYPRRQHHLPPSHPLRTPPSTYRLLVNKRCR